MILNDLIKINRNNSNIIQIVRIINKRKETIQFNLEENNCYN